MRNLSRSRQSKRSERRAAPGEKSKLSPDSAGEKPGRLSKSFALDSKAYTEGFYYKPRIDKELLAQHSKGLIALSSCMSGVPSALLAQDRFEDAAAAALEFQDIMGKGNYFLEIQEHGLEPQARIRKPLVELSKKTGIPLVATNDAHYLMPDDARAHDVLLCIGSGKTRQRRESSALSHAQFLCAVARKRCGRSSAHELPDALQAHGRDCRACAT